MKDRLSCYEHLQLEAYRSLDRWNDHEARIVFIFDGVVLLFLSVTIFKDKDTCDALMDTLLTGIGMFLILWWLALSKRSFDRIKKRYVLMRNIERLLGFRAHRAVHEFVESSRW